MAESPRVAAQAHGQGSWRHDPIGLPAGLQAGTQLRHSGYRVHQSVKVMIHPGCCHAKEKAVLSRNMKIHDK